MSKEFPSYPFLRDAGRVINSGQSRTLALTGNIHDLFLAYGQEGQDYVPLVDYLTHSWNLPGIVVVVYELNGPIRFCTEEGSAYMRDAWLQWRSGYDSSELAIQQMTARDRTAADIEHIVGTYDESLRKALNNPTLALELLRQMCLCSRTRINGQPLMADNLIVIIESADMILPEAPITSLSDTDRQRIGICQDWFSDLGFVSGADSVVLIAESRSQIHHRVATLPQLLEIEVPSPVLETREHFIGWYAGSLPPGAELRLWGSVGELARFTAGLSLHALLQLLKRATHDQEPLGQETVIAKVESYIKSQLGEDVVEFKKPQQTLDDVVGFSRLKAFLRRELIPRFSTTGSEALAGAAVAGPIGGGKTFIFEALATELNMVVLVIKNIRSQWFGQTDVIFERLRRVLYALSKVLIFMDEADTQLGGVGADAHPTERRLTGRIQGMMSDPGLRGRVAWLLITARIHLLSPDLRRPGRAGDLIIPVLDPDGEDREEFVRWMAAPVLGEDLDQSRLERLKEATGSHSAAAFASLRSELRAKGGRLGFEEVLEIIRDHIPPAIAKTRRYQTLQALTNCTRRSLLPAGESHDSRRVEWEEEMLQLEAKGIR